MPAKNEKERRKRKKRREDLHRKEKILAAYQPPPEPTIDPRPRAIPPVAPKPPAREPTPIDTWWDDFAAADGPGQLRMVREKLETMQPGDEWFEALVPEAVDELAQRLSKAEYVAFLEELRQTHPAAFAAGGDWNVWTLAMFYVAQERWEDLDRAIAQFADTLSEVREPFFSVMSLIRLAGRSEAAQRLIEAAMSPQPRAEMLPRAVKVLTEWAMFAPYQACVAAGATDEALDAAYQRLREIGGEASDEIWQIQREFVLHLAGQCDPFTRDQFRNDDRPTRRRMYLLTADFMRWLCASRGFSPLVADELRRILLQTINDLECPPTAVFRGLRRAELEPALACKLGFMSLDTFHAPAGVVALQQFYDFLAQSGLADPRDRDSTSTVCRKLWAELKRSMKDEWQHCQFLERCLPPAP